MSKRRCTPPIVPVVGFEGDSSNFEEYDEEPGYEVCLDESVADIYADIFADF